MLKVLLLAGVVFVTFAPVDHASAHAGRHDHRASPQPLNVPRHCASRRRHGARFRAGKHRSATNGQTGKASYYGGRRPTANGDHVGIATCAHPTLPFGTRVRVTNLGNARQAILTVNDRGPFVRGRIVDVSTAAAGLLGMLRAGTALVRVEVVGPA